MTIPFLDALPPFVAIGNAKNGPVQAASGGFEALLAGLTAGQATATPEQPIASPVELLSAVPSAHAVLPTLPGAILPPTGKSLQGDGGDAFALEFAIEPASAASDDKSLLWAAESEGPPLTVTTPDAIVPVPVTIVPIVANDPIPSAGSSEPTAGLAVLSSPRQTAEQQTGAQRTGETPVTTRKVAIGDLRRTARGEQLAAPIDSAPAVTAPTPEPRAGTPSPTPAPNVPNAPKPAQVFAPSLAILPPAVQPAASDAAPTPSRRGQERKLSLIAPAFALESLPAAIVAAPAPVLPANPVAEAGPAASPISPQPIALPDHRALVEALVRARAERDPGVSVALETREFGAVALRFETLQNVTGERELQVALSSGDPGFERAVASAAAAQAALADQSGRNPASRGDPGAARSAEPSANPFGDASGGRAASSDPQSQHRPGAAEAWREPRSRQSADGLARGDDPATAALSTAARADRRSGSIFA